MVDPVATTPRRAGLECDQRRTQPRHVQELDAMAVQDGERTAVQHRLGLCVLFAVDAVLRETLDHPLARVAVGVIAETP
jgi:hypothetical protein